jgi:hypothetical protein
MAELLNQLYQVRGDLLQRAQQRIGTEYGKYEEKNLVLKFFITVFDASNFACHDVHVPFIIIIIFMD